MMKNAFYFYTFALTFWSSKWKNDLIRKIKLFPKFKTSQFGKQKTTTHLLDHISRQKSNQTMKFDPLM